MHALSMHECKHACMYCIALYLRLLGTTIQHGMSESIHLQFMQTNKATLSIHPCMYVRTYVCMYVLCMYAHMFPHAQVHAFMDIYKFPCKNLHSIFAYSLGNRVIHIESIHTVFRTYNAQIYIRGNHSRLNHVPVMRNMFKQHVCNIIGKCL